MELFPRTEPLERVAEAGGEASAPPYDGARARNAAPAKNAASATSAGVVAKLSASPAVRESAAPPIEGGLPEVGGSATVWQKGPAPARIGEGGRTTIVLLASLGAHALAAAVLAALPAGSTMLAASTAPIEIEMAFPLEPEPEAIALPAPEPEIVPEPQPAPVPVARAERPRVETPPAPRPEPQEVAPEPEAPAPAPAAIGPAPPSIDDVFADPAPPPAVMGAEGGGFAMAAGSPGGRAGGVPGGTGTGIGGGGGAGVGASGPSVADIRRARRAYTNEIRELLARHARYPVAARAQRLAGRVELALRIADDGSLIAARVVGSCGYAVLDDAAIATVNDIRTFPRPPALVPWDPREEVRTSLVYEVTR